MSKKKFANEARRSVASLSDLLEKNLTLESVRAAGWWEALRLLYFTHALPPYWRKLADKEEIPSSRPPGHYDLIFGLEDFPCNTWEEVSEADQRAVEKAVGMPRRKAFRFIDAHEGRWAVRFLLSEAKKVEGAAQGAFGEYLSACEAAPSIARSPTRTLELPDGTFVALVQIDPSQGKLAIKEAAANEVEVLVGRIQPSRQHNQVQQWKTRLRGLASLWLEQEGYDLGERNSRLFEDRETKLEGDPKKDRTSLNLAEKSARELIESLQGGLLKEGNAFDREVQKEDREREEFVQRAKDSGLWIAEDEQDGSSQP